MTDEIKVFTVNDIKEHAEEYKKEKYKRPKIRLIHYFMLFVLFIYFMSLLFLFICNSPINDMASDWVHRYPNRFTYLTRLVSGGLIAFSLLGYNYYNEYFKIKSILKIRVNECIIIIQGLLKIQENSNIDQIKCDASFAKTGVDLQNIIKNDIDGWLNELYIMLNTCEFQNKVDSIIENQGNKDLCDYLSDSNKKIKIINKRVNDLFEYSINTLSKYPGDISPGEISQYCKSCKSLMS